MLFELLYNAWAMGSQHPINHALYNGLTPMSHVLYNGVVQRCMAHAPWDPVTLHGP